MRLPMVVTVLFCGCIALGYQMSIFPIIVHDVSASLSLNSSAQSSLLLLLPLTAALTAVLSGWLSDRLGRRLLLVSGIILLTLGGFQSAIAESLPEFVCGRLMVSAGIGLMVVLIPLYLVELAPVDSRGQWIALFVLFINVGIFLASLSGGTHVFHQNWRLCMMVGASLCLLLYLCSFLFPESPRWLLFKGQQGRASQLLIHLFGSKQAMKVINQMDAVHHRHIYQRIRLWSFQGMRLLLVGMLINIFSQVLGLHVVVSYTALVLEKMNFQDHFVQLAANIFTAFIMMLGAFFATHLIDHISRRKLLLIGLAGMAVGLVCIIGALRMPETIYRGWIILMGAVVFVLTRGVSLGPMAFLLPAEIFPQSLRGLGMGLSLAAGWATDLIVVHAFPTMISEYGANLSFVVFLLFAIIAWGWCFVNVPNTTKQSLEKIETDFYDPEGEGADGIVAGASVLSSSPSSPEGDRDFAC